MILDSGERTEYETGAVRDIQEGKGRCDLMPLEVVARLLDTKVIKWIEYFRESRNIEYLYDCLRSFQKEHSHFKSMEEMLLDVAIHFEEGAKKYGENNWQKGIPLHSYIDSGVRHYLKFKAVILDEQHGRAFVWNILCAIWTATNRPELNDFSCKEDEKVTHIEVEDYVRALFGKNNGVVKEIEKATATQTASDEVAKDHAEHFWEFRG